jgi:peroxiredoxin/DNA-binding transcriptional MerR regulator
LTFPLRARFSVELVDSMKISDLARQAGVTTKAVRYYESLGLIAPERLANGYRIYCEDDVRLVREIRTLHHLGIPVERTRPFLECLSAGRLHADDCPASLASYRATIDELTERIEALTARRATLIRNLNAAAHRGSGVELSAATDPGIEDYSTLPKELPAPEDDGAADHLNATIVPPIGLLSTAGTAIRLDTLGPRRTVIYIYPLTGRPGIDLPAGWNSIPGARGCTPEACGFRDHFHDLLEAGAGRVYGLSSQDTGYQNEVVERLGLPFEMLSDPALSLADALGLPTFEASGTRLFKRLTLVIRDGVIEHVFYPIFPPDEHAEQVLTWLRENPL